VVASDPLPQFASNAAVYAYSTDQCAKLGEWEASEAVAAAHVGHSL
jgi:hypothetical protein